LRASKTQSTRWVIRLQGGGWCYSVDSCASRLKYSPYWMTSTFCPPNMTDFTTISGVAHGGILSSNATINPNFYDANQVYVWYCSSDSMRADRPASNATGGWHFRGLRIVQQIILDLLFNQTPSLQNATQVLLTGDSAGGVATFNNADEIGEMIKLINPQVYYRAFVDAGMFLDYPVYNSGYISFSEIAQALITFNGVQYAPLCVINLPNENWKCFHLQYFQPYLITPTIYHEFRFDGANLGFDGVPAPPYSNVTTNWILTFGTNMTLQLLNLAAFFSPACTLHEVIDSNYFNDIIVQGTTFAPVLGNWFLNGNKPVHLTDSCQTIECNPTCPPLSTSDDIIEDDLPLSDRIIRGIGI